VAVNGNGRKGRKSGVEGVRKEKKTRHPGRGKSGKYDTNRVNYRTIGWREAYSPKGKKVEIRTAISCQRKCSKLGEYSRRKGRPKGKRNTCLGGLGQRGNKSYTTVRLNRTAFRRRIYETYDLRFNIGGKGKGSQTTVHYP